MAKCAFIFPGQGSQYMGMGKDLAEKHSVAKSVFQEADRVLGYDLSSIIFEGDEKELRRTEITQPAIMTTSIAILEVLKEKGIRPEAVAGLSLGEYSALVCAGVLNFREALLIVQERARLMQYTVPQGSGEMAAILGLESKEVEELCQQSSSFGCVEPANYNCPGQVVVAGQKEAVEELCRLARLRKARAVPLSVSAPFHCSLLSPLEEKMSDLLKEVHFNRPFVPFVANIHARYLQSPEEIKRALASQVYNPVRWDESMRLLIKDGYDLFVEIGPGRVLTGFMKKISRDVKAIRVEDGETLSIFFKLLEEEV